MRRPGGKSHGQAGYIEAGRPAAPRGQEQPAGKPVRDRVVRSHRFCFLAQGRDFRAAGTSCWMNGPSGQPRTSMSGKGPYGRVRRGSRPSRGFLGPSPRAHLVLRQPSGAGRGSVGPGRLRVAVTWAAVQPVFLLQGSGGVGGRAPDHGWGSGSPWVGWHLLLMPINSGHRKSHLLRHAGSRWLPRQVCHQRHTP